MGNAYRVSKERELEMRIQVACAILPSMLMGTSLAQPADSILKLSKEQLGDLCSQVSEIAVSLVGRLVAGTDDPSKAAEQPRHGVPVDALINLYNETLPMLPRCEIGPGSRAIAAKALRDVDGNLSSWAATFQRVRDKCPRLTMPSADLGNWTASFVWLCTNSKEGAPNKHVIDSGKHDDRLQIVRDIQKKKQADAERLEKAANADVELHQAMPEGWKWKPGAKQP